MEIHGTGAEVLSLTWRRVTLLPLPSRLSTAHFNAAWLPLSLSIATTTTPNPSLKHGFSQHHAFWSHSLLFPCLMVLHAKGIENMVKNCILRKNNKRDSQVSSKEAKLQCSCFPLLRRSQRGKKDNQNKNRDPISLLLLYLLNPAGSLLDIRPLLNVRLTTLEPYPDEPLHLRHAPLTAHHVSIKHLVSDGLRDPGGEVLVAAALLDEIRREASRHDLEHQNAEAPDIGFLSDAASLAVLGRFVGYHVVLCVLLVHHRDQPVVRQERGVVTVQEDVRGLEVPVWSRQARELVVEVNQATAHALHNFQPGRPVQTVSASRSLNGQANFGGIIGHEQLLLLPVVEPHDLENVGMGKPSEPPHVLVKLLLVHVVHVPEPLHDHHLSVVEGRLVSRPEHAAAQDLGRGLQ
ncbi:protein kinase family protein [Striga asiatica]|uniref:Protein kinase family protein n=1 Tax=Striga asiatica TaxID=4170 RepID=A0A5A7Q942_STRAF|nr:protein kinase family protein [Striga asiatica]